jgi:hypothetical protein
MKESVSYAVIGDIDSPATLTSAYSGNRLTLTDTHKFRGLQLYGKFTPAVDNTQVFITVEADMDGSGNWFNLSVGDSASSDAEIGIGATGGVDGSDYGIPIAIPKTGGSSVTNTAIPIWWATEKFAARQLRISAKDSNGGTLYLGVTLFS